MALVHNGRAVRTKGKRAGPRLGVRSPTVAVTWLRVCECYVALRYPSGC